jgi:tRNA A-37 threonylcarbamoyl transferase component Bud32
VADLKCSHCGFVNPPVKKSCQRCGTPLPRVQIRQQAAADPAIQFRRGQIIAQRYTVLDLIGRGGMACIYKVQDNTLKEAVALKTMLPEFSREKALIDRFYNEAKIARQLTHPNIVRVHDIGMAEGVMYISMELLEGRSLRGILDGLPAGQRLPVKTALRIVDQLCAALDYAHNFTIHRDIKPENVMVLNDGTVKLMDFGISKLRADSSLTATSMVMGTPHYMSPEQLKDSRNVDARTDVYSMGVLLYEVLTGNIPTGVPKPASQIMKETPPDLDRIIQQCMEPDPISRYQSIKELRVAIRAILDVVDANTTAPIDKPKAKKKPQREGAGRQAVGVALMLIVAAAAAGVIWLLDGRRQALIADAASTQEVLTATATPEQREYQSFQAWAERADVIAARHAAAADDEGLNEILVQARSLMDEAGTYASMADFAGAVPVARSGLACYMGLIACPDDALFVPPGTVASLEYPQEIDAFFIDAYPVTRSEFATFTQSVEGGWGAYPVGVADEPATGLTFYDALMYAAWHGCRLPTLAEWLRAFEVYPEAMAAPVADWTQTRADGLAHNPNADELERLRFGAELVTIQAIETDDGPIVDQGPFPFGQGDATLGVRCAWPVPLDAESVENALSAAQVNS